MFSCFVFYAFTASTRAVPNDARGMVQTNSVEFPFSVHGGRRAQEVASENVLSPYVVNGKYFKCVFAFVGVFFVFFVDEIDRAVNRVSSDDAPTHRTRVLTSCVLVFANE